MVTAKDFRRHASECRQMARSTRDLEDRANWNRLAERWDRCAALEEGRAAPAHHADKYRREQRPMYRHAS